MRFFIFLALFFNLSLKAQVGIKTNSPTNTLDVNGSARVQELSKGVVNVKSDGVVSTTSNLGYAAGNLTWNSLLIGTESSILIFTGKETVTDSLISFTIHYDKDDQIFYSMLLSGCTFTNLGFSEGNNGSFSITVDSTSYIFTFINEGDLANVNCPSSSISGTFFSIVY